MTRFAMAIPEPLHIVEWRGLFRVITESGEDLYRGATGGLSSWAQTSGFG